MIQFVLQGETVAKKNANKFNRKTKVMYKDAGYQEWHENARLQLMCQWHKLNLKTIDKSDIKLEFYHADNRRRDGDNGTNSIFDLLVECKVIADDSWQHVPHHDVYNYPTSKENGSFCIITIDKIQ